MECAFLPDRPISNVEIKIPQSSSLKIGDFFDGESHWLLGYMQKRNIAEPALVVYLTPTDISGLKGNWVMRFSHIAETVSPKIISLARRPRGRKRTGPPPKRLEKLASQRLICQKWGKSWNIASCFRQIATFIGLRACYNTTAHFSFT